MSGMSEAERRALVEAVEMVGRTGAKSFELGYLVDDPPPGVANWYASAEYRAGTMTTDLHVSPIDAARQLAELLQDGARCRYCGRRISWGDRPANNARRRRWCWWRRVGGKWKRGCPGNDPVTPAGWRP